MRILSSVFVASIVLASAARADSALLRDELVENLIFMKGVYRAEYAPAAWKKTYAGWDLETEIKKAIDAAKNTPDLDLKGAQKIVRSFIYSMKDYHTSVSFQSTESASLPFTVKGAAGKLFIVYVDRAKLTNDAFPFDLGDELVSFDGVAAADAVAAVQAEIPGNVDATDRMRAELALTSRSGTKGYKIPQGPITLGIRPQGSKQVKTVQLIWDYSPERINDPFINQGPVLAEASDDGMPSLLAMNGPRLGDDIDPSRKTKVSNLLRPQMVVDVSGAVVTATEAASDNPYTIGARKAFTPELGMKLWESDAGSEFYAYMYRTPDRRIIGYVRIPSYVPSDTNGAVAEFAKLIATFEKATDALVIDQIDNPGGSVFYLYTLASMLSDQPLATPRHRMAVAQADVLDAYTRLSRLEKVTNDEQAKAVLGDKVEGYPVSYEVAQFTRNYLKFLISEFNAGRTLTRPYWIEGADHINPAATHYTKPILLVINNLDFSGGDFFPAIMQDNKRVTVFGTRTAGAGGYVNDISFPNDLGINAIRCTESIAERLDKNPIENLGVKPDIAYDLTEADVTGGYAGYAKAINDAVLGLLGK